MVVGCFILMWCVRREAWCKLQLSSKETIAEERRCCARVSVTVWVLDGAEALYPGKMCVAIAYSVKVQLWTSL